MTKLCFTEESHIEYVIVPGLQRTPLGRVEVEG